MSLVSCSECGNHISDRAPMCPTCGAPNGPVAGGQPDAGKPRYFLLAVIEVVPVI